MKRGSQPKLPDPMIQMVRCPKCGAMPGRPCGDNRNRHAGKLDPHKERIEEARNRPGLAVRR